MVKLVCSSCDTKVVRDRSVGHLHDDYADGDGTLYPVRITCYRCPNCTLTKSHKFIRFNSAWQYVGTASPEECFAARKTSNSMARIGSTASEWTKRMSRGHG